MKELLKILVKDKKVRKLFKELTKSKNCCIRAFDGKNDSITVGYIEVIRCEAVYAQYNVAVHYYEYENPSILPVITITIEESLFSNKVCYRSLDVRNIVSIETTVLELLEEYIDKQFSRFEAQQLLLKEKLK